MPSLRRVFTVPASIGAIAFQNKAAVYDLLFRTAADTLTTIAADPTTGADGKTYQMLAMPIALACLARRLGVQVEPPKPS